MAATDVITTTEYIKPSCVHNDCSIAHRSTEKTHVFIPCKQVEQSEPVNTFSFTEPQSTRQARINSLSHWPHITPSKESMATAGWFSCNVVDRVICIYCNTICHQWTRSDNPVEVHRQLAPKCPFVLSILPMNPLPQVISDKLLERFEPAHPAMAEISRREATFTSSTWTNDSPSIESLVRAGFFCTGMANTVTCFYCNGSLHKWGSNDNPMIEHARWFSHCLYAKHLCGNDIYEKIQLSKKRLNTEKPISSVDIPRLIAARIDLPIVEQLRKTYKLAIIKRCLEDQLKAKNDDFKTDTDFRIACLILQKQIDHIQGCSDKIITPSTLQSKISKKSNRNNLGECLVCLTEEKQLACMPCGHLCACVPCGYALKTCPICREKIQSFMRINC